MLGPLESYICKLWLPVRVFWFVSGVLIIVGLTLSSVTQVSLMTIMTCSTLRATLPLALHPELKENVI